MKNFKELIKDSNKILLITSQPFDPDCISSGILMKKYIEHLGFDVTLYYPSKITSFDIDRNKNTPYFDELKTSDTRDALKDLSYDTLILLDGPNFIQFYDFKNTELPPPDISHFKKVILVDHHAGEPEKLATHKFKDSKASSTIEIILSKLVPFSFLDSKLATLAYFGLIGDTGNFRWHVSAKTLKIASKLIQSGAEPYQLIEDMFFSKKKSSLEMYSLVLNNITYDDRLKTIFMFLPYSKRVDLDITDDDKFKIFRSIFLSEISYFVEGYPRGIIMTEVPERGVVYVSARGSTLLNKVNFPEFFKKIGGNGGGHFNASGLELKGNFEDVKKAVLYELDKELNLLS